MYKTGDLTKNLEKLKNELKLIKFPKERLDDNILLEGHPVAFLQILHFTFLYYSQYVAQFMLDNDYRLSTISDKELFEKIHHAAINLFNNKPTISSTQFFKLNHYAEAKVIFCLEMIKLVKQCHNNLIKKTYSKNTSKLNIGKKEQQPEKKIKVINHLQEDYSDYQEDGILASPKFNEDIEYNRPMQNEELDEEFENNSFRRESFGLEEDESNKGLNNYHDTNYKGNTVSDSQRNDFSQVIEIINNLAGSVKDMTNKVESFKNNMESRVSKLEADMTLLKNRMNMMENMKSKSSYEKNLMNTSEEHLFSFAVETEKKEEKEENFKQENSIINHSKKPPYTSYQNSKVLNEIEDADSIIERVTNRFRETQRLLNDYDKKN
jgi:hypothetical protein